MKDVRSLPDLMPLAVVLMILFALVWFVREWPEAHRRTARLRAFQSRSRWRKADLPRLRRLGIHVPSVRLRRIENSRVRGRGVVARYHAPEVVLRAGIANFNAVLAPTTAPRTRVARLRKIPFLWIRVVEALYRGEYAALKTVGSKAAAATAEDFVAAKLGLSAADIHRRCWAIRKEQDGSGMPSLTIDEFEQWKREGGFIWPGFTESNVLTS